MSCGWYVLLEKTPLPSFKFAKNPVKDRRNNGRETKYAKKIQTFFGNTVINLCVYAKYRGKRKRGRTLVGCLNQISPFQASPA
jgi:hypothetical protein